ncbi:MAG: pentapeptide repeat-containing protein [Deltaproteobacteria bacterium]
MNRFHRSSGALAGALALALAGCSRSTGTQEEGPPPLSDRPWVTLKELAANPGLHVQPHQHVIFDLSRLPAGAEAAPRTYKIPLYLAQSHDLRMRLEEQEPCFAEISLSFHDGTRIFTLHKGSRSAGTQLRKGHVDLLVRLADPLPARCTVAFMSLKKSPAAQAPSGASADVAATAIETAPNLTRAFQILDPGTGQVLPTLACTGVHCPYLLSIDPLPSITVANPFQTPILGMPKFVPVGDGGYGWSHARLDPTNPADQFAITPVSGSSTSFQLAAYAGSYASSSGVAQPLALLTPDCTLARYQFVCTLPAAPNPPSSLVLAGGQGAPAPAAVQVSQASPHVFSFTFPLGGANTAAVLSPTTYAQTQDPRQASELLLTTRASGGNGSYTFQAREVYRMYDQCSAAPQCCNGTCNGPTLQAGEISLSSWVNGSPRVFVFNSDAPVPFLNPISNWTLTLGPDTTTAHCYSLPAFEGDVQIPGPGVPCQSLRVHLASQVVFTSDCPSCNLDGADLSASNFDGRDFSSSTFRKADLSGSTFRGVDFTGVDATGANLTGAILDGSTWGGTQAGYYGLKGTNLTRASFQRASLRLMQFDATVTFDSTNFDSADLTGALFSTANLDGSSFRYVDFTPPSVPPAEPAFGSGQTFLGTNLPYVRLDGAVLDYQNLHGTNMPGVSAFNTSFYKAYLFEVVMPYAVLKGANFSESTLQGTAMAGSNLYGARFHLAHLNASPSTGRATNLQGSLLINADFSNSNASGADFSYSILGSTSQSETCQPGTDTSAPCASFYEAIITGTRFDNAYLGHVNFGGTNGSDPSFLNAAIIGCNFSGAIYTHEPTKTGGVVEFGNSFLFGTDMGQSGTQLAFADFFNAFLDPASAPPGTTGFATVSLDPTHYSTFRQSPYSAKQLCVTTTITVPQSPPPSDVHSTCPDGLGGPCSRASWTSASDLSLPYQPGISVAYGSSMPKPPLSGCSANASVQLPTWNEGFLSLPRSEITQVKSASNSSGCVVTLDPSTPQGPLSLDLAWPVTYTSCNGPWPMISRCQMIVKAPVTTSTGPLTATLTDGESLIPVQVSCGMTPSKWTATATATSSSGCSFPVTLANTFGPVSVTGAMPAGWSFSQGTCSAKATSCSASVTVAPGLNGGVVLSDGVSSVPVSLDCQSDLVLSGPSSFSDWPSPDGGCHFTVGVQAALGPVSLSGGGGAVSMSNSTCDGVTYPCSFTLNAGGSYAAYPASVSVTDGTNFAPVSASCGMYLPQGANYSTRPDASRNCTWTIPVAYPSAAVGTASLPSSSTCGSGGLPACTLTVGPVPLGSGTGLGQRDLVQGGYRGTNIPVWLSCQ